MKKIITIVLFFVAAILQSKAQGLVINEIDYDQPSVDSTEFIELYNSSANAINLGIYRVVLVNGNNNTGYDSIALPNQLLLPDHYFVICSSYGTVPLCDMSHTTPAGGFIQNGSPDAVAIRDTVSGGIVDAVSYEGNVAPPYIEGNGVPIGQSDTATSAATLFRWTGISRFPDGTDTGDDSTDFHRSCSTPGMANVNTTANCPQPTAVQNIVVNTSIAVYPNPAKGLVTIDMKGINSSNTSIIVTDLLGNLLRKISLRNSEMSYQLNLSEFQDGVYFVKVKSDAGQFMQRIILKK